MSLISLSARGVQSKPSRQSQLAGRHAKQGHAAIVGCGVFSPSATSTNDLVNFLQAGESQHHPTQRRLTSLDELRSASALGPREIKKVDRFSLLAIAAARAALHEASLSQEEVARCGIVTGNMMCGWTFTEPQVRALHSQNHTEVSPYMATAWFPAAPQGQVTIHLKMRGFAKTLTTDRCAGAQAIGMAFGRIRCGRSPLLLAGGVEAPVTSFVEAAYRQLPNSAGNSSEAAAYLLLRADGPPGVAIGAHTTFRLPQSDYFPFEIMVRHITDFLQGLPDHLPLDAVICNVMTSASVEEAAASAALPGTRARLLYPMRAFGDCLAASGPVSAAVAYTLLARGDKPSSALVVSVGHQCGDLLWMYRDT